MSDNLIKKKSKAKSEYRLPFPLEEKLKEKMDEVTGGPHYHFIRSPYPLEGDAKEITKNYRTKKEAREELARYPMRVQEAFHIPELDEVHFSKMRTEKPRCKIDRTWVAEFHLCKNPNCRKGDWTPD